MKHLCTLASGMEASGYFAPAITIIELAQETSVCHTGSVQNGNMKTDDLGDDEFISASMFD